MYYIAKGKTATLATRKIDLADKGSEIFEFEIIDIFKILKEYNNVYLCGAELYLKENNKIIKGQFIVEQINIFEHYLVTIDTQEQEIYRPAFMLHCIDGNDYLINDVKSLYELNVCKLLSIDSKLLSKEFKSHNLTFADFFHQFALKLGKLSNNYTISSNVPEDDESYTHINYEQANELINSESYIEQLQAVCDRVGNDNSSIFANVFYKYTDIVKPFYCDTCFQCKSFDTEVEYNEESELGNPFYIFTCKKCSSKWEVNNKKKLVCFYGKDKEKIFL
ncbi:hypothetical protein AAFX13_00285 [Vibrio parahaemolyticus]|uniref:hypothetical protein n=1 Tax=Vibrio parahaemolyticus TaxID=670 RepID=UPI00398157EE